MVHTGNVSRAEIEQTYAISRRIEGEERSLDCATMVLTSTQQEIDEQWGLYDGCAPEVFQCQSCGDSPLLQDLVLVNGRHASFPHFPLSHPGYSLYRYEKNLEAVLRSRRRIGRHMPTMRVIPPGLDFTNLKVDLPMQEGAPGPAPGKGALPGKNSATFSPRAGEAVPKDKRDSIDSSACHAQWPTCPATCCY